jgi:UDP-N-acetylglucosamine--N-acetylmuramyl-(pentapeptide) pyrophosphoryl-undecaprenol N-acetylglucosamine transferase
MKTLFVASAGGHLAELSRLEPRLRGIPTDATWVTFDTPQSRSLLEGRDIVFVRHTYPRDVSSVIRNIATAQRLLGRGTEFSAVVSNGSGIALSFIPVARAHGIACHYIESGSRVDGHSVTGRLLAGVPGVKLYTQYPAHDGVRWRYRGSILDAFSPAPARDRDVRRIVVTLGTTPYGFRRLVEQVLRIVPEGVEVSWQIGPTDVTGLPVEERRLVPVPELEADIRDADAVIAHAGFATAVTALDLGHCPVLVPRRWDLHENVDDHQAEIARELAQRDLAVDRPVEALTWNDVVTAASKRVNVLHDLPPLDLGTASIPSPVVTEPSSS